MPLCPYGAPRAVLVDVRADGEPPLSGQLHRGGRGKRLDTNRTGLRTRGRLARLALHENERSAGYREVGLGRDEFVDEAAYVIGIQPALLGEHRRSEEVPVTTINEMPQVRASANAERLFAGVSIVSLLAS